MTANLILYYYLAILNSLAFVLYGLDKYKAVKNKWRISESTLLGVAFLGGSIGALLAMKCFHHKTLHKKFAWGVPLILLLQTGICLYLFLR